MEMQGFTQLLVLTMGIAMSYFIYASYKIKNNQDKKIKQAIKKIEENYKFALWGSGDEIWEWTIKTDKLVRSNPIKLLNSSELPSDLHMKDILSLIHPDDFSHIQSSFQKLVKLEEPQFEETFRINSNNNRYLSVLARARVVEKNYQNQTIKVMGSLKDITLIKATEDKLSLIAKAFNNTMDGISVLDTNFKAVLNNQAFYTITGQVFADSINKQYFFSEESLNYEQYHQVKVALSNFGGWEGEIWEKKASGEDFAIELKIDVVRNLNREISHYICIFSDITYRKKSDEELRKLANFDSLTGLPNRSLFMDRLSHALAYSKRNKTQFALLFIDLDNFKTINDSMGHSSGDLLLQKVAKRLIRCVRDSDTVARLGGDEFTIILENINSADEAGICANKIIKRMMTSMDISGTPLITSPSIGIGVYPDNGTDIETLLKNADLAMYSAKENGRNNYQFFNKKMTGSAIERINIENKLRDAISMKQLELYYQPKVNTLNGKLTGFEALIRWIHPTEGIISPASFIPVAEETGLILPMGDWILEEAISQAKKWSEINPDCSVIAINLSARQFQQEGLLDKIKELLDTYDLLPKFIELEITEGTLMSNMTHTISTLNSLRNMDISLALDDFGTGYSSLSYLKKFPVNKLKVDQSFVRDITTDPGDASIVASIISLAHNLELTVVAEGCESPGQLDFIQAYGCEEVQGYLFSRPLTKDDAEVILQLGKIELPR